MKHVPVLVLGVIFCSAVLVSGCGRPKKSMSEKISEKIAEKAIAMNIKDSQGKDAKVDISDGKLTVKTKDGETSFASGEGAAIPENFPKDVYVVKGAKIQMAMKTPDGFALSMKVDQAAATVAATYEKELKAEGWEQEGSFDMSGTRSLAYKKGERQVAIVMTKSEEATDVMITVAEKK
jgi:hypothetical protein